MSTKRYKRNSTNLTISLFYEHHCLNKFNYDPPYQRDYNIWSDNQKSFLIDTILKNFPMPPIFLEQKITNGITMFDVIDGKQRLNTIIDFIEGKVALPKNFGDDSYGNSKINGLKFSEIKDIAKQDDDISDYIDTFWGYILNIEYIEKPDEKIVDNIFDRLNRGGERLNSAELRKAKYYDSLLYSGIVEISKKESIAHLVRYLDAVRLENISFITEIYLLALTKTINSGVEKDIDDIFFKHVESVNVEKNIQIIDTVEEIMNVFKKFNLELNDYQINGTSHLYALIYVAFYLYSHRIQVTDSIVEKLNEFYSDLRSLKTSKNTRDYSASMQSASKSKSSRKKRIKSILEYLGFSDLSIK